MADKNNGSARLRHVVHLAQTFFLKLGVAHRQSFVDEENFRIEVRRDGESEPHIHSAGIPLYRRVKELINPGEGNDFGKLLLNLDALHAEYRSVHKNVFAAG